MALGGFSLTSYLRRLEAVWPGQLPFLVSMFCWKDNAASNGNAFVLGQQADVLQFHKAIHRSSDDTMLVQSRAVSGAIPSAGISPTPNAEWFHVLVEFISPTLRGILVNGGSRQTNTDNVPTGSYDVTTIGIGSAFTGPWQNTGALAEVSIWDGAGLTLQDRSDLAAFLAGGGNPLATNAVGGAPWQGNLVQTPDGAAYASMQTPDQLGPFEMVGSLSVFASHPPVAVAAPQIVRSASNSGSTTTVSVPIQVTADDGPNLGLIAAVGWRVSPPGVSPVSVERGAQSFQIAGPEGPASFAMGINAKAEFWVLPAPAVGTIDVVATRHPSQEVGSRVMIVAVILFRYIKQNNMIRSLVFEAFTLEESDPEPHMYDPDPEANLNEIVLGSLTYSRGDETAFTILEGLLLETAGTGEQTGDSARGVLAANVEQPVEIELVSTFTGSRQAYMAAGVPNSVFLPDPPTALTVDQANDVEAFLSWIHPGGAGIFYEIGRAPDSSGEPGPFLVIDEGIEVMEYHDSGLNPDTTYWWRVRSQEGGLLSEWSVPFMSTLAPARPAAMSLTQAEP